MISLGRNMDISPKQARQELGLSINDMARACGIHRQTWVKWEREERKPSAAALQLIKILFWLKDKNILSNYLNIL